MKKILKKINKNLKRNLYRISGVLMGYTILGGTCLASMPWETPLTTIEESLIGPVATLVGTIAVLFTGFALAFGEGGGAGRKALQVVFGLSLTLAAANYISIFT